MQTDSDKKLISQKNIAKRTDLPLMEAFYTIQGEGFHCGSAAYFIRLAGCDVGCVWCDVKESWNAGEYPLVAVEKIVTEAVLHPSRIAVITGGEPLMYDLTVLSQQLQVAKFQTHIETSGAYPLTGNWNWITLSPKKYKKPLPEICSQAHELKIIIYNKSDFRWAEEYSSLVNTNCKLYLQPEWSVAEKVIPMLVEYVKQNPQWRISLQTHKYLNIP